MAIFTYLLATTMNIYIFSRTGLMMILFWFATTNDSIGQQQDSIDAKASQVLSSMSDLLTSAKALRFNAEVTTESVLSNGQKIQFGRSIDVLQQRPNRLRAFIKEDHLDIGFWYDGQTITLLDRLENHYASSKAPPNVDQTLDFALDEFGITVPLADFLYSDVYGVLTENVQTGTYVGLNSLGGVQMHHLAFTQETIDWQIWIEDGPVMVPRRLVISYKTLPSSPQFSALLSNWTFHDHMPEVLFQFTPEVGSDMIEFLPTSAN